MKETKHTTIDGYISEFPPEIAERLTQIRNTIRDAAPEAKEVISYHMPAFRQGKILVYFAAHQRHIGFYALPTGNEAFKEELKKYVTGKGSIQFPYAEPLPLDLIRDMVLFRLAEVTGQI